MHSVPPQQLLSAYLDGELSPSEREDVERLLRKSPDARQELKELEQIRELLKQLPREALPETFAARVLQACGQSASAETESATKAPVPSSARLKVRHWWVALAGVAVSAAALMLMIWLSSPEPQNTQPAQIARQSPQADVEDRPMPGEQASAPADRESGVMNEDLVRKQPSPDDSAAGVASTPPAVTTDDPKEEQAALMAGQDFKQARLAQIVEAVEPAENQVAVVKLSVADRRQGLRDLQELLQRHQITPADPPASPADRQQESETLAMDDAPSSKALVAVYVETQGDQLTAALQELQKQAGFRRLLVDDPIAQAQLGPLMGLSVADSAVGRRNRGMRFSTAGSELPDARSLIPPQRKAAREPQAEPASPAQTEQAEEADADPAPERPKRFRAESAKDDGKAPKIAADAKPQERMRSLPTGAARSAPLPAVPEVKKPGTTTLRKGFAGSATNADAAAGSRQRQVTLPEETLTTLQKQAAQSPSDRSEADTAEDTDKQPKSPQRVQILFVLIQDPAAEPAEPADQSPPQDR